MRRGALFLSFCGALLGFSHFAQGQDIQCSKEVPTTVPDSQQVVSQEYGPASNEKKPGSAKFEAQVGVAAPIGNLGLALDILPASYLAVNVGLGTSIYGRQFEVMPRYRIPIDGSETKFAFGVGYSVGKYGWANQSAPFLSEYPEGTVFLHWNWAQWGNLEASLDFDGISPRLRLFGGATLMLNRNSPARCTTAFDDDTQCVTMPLDQAWFAYGGIALSFFGI